LRAQGHPQRDRIAILVASGLPPHPIAERGGIGCKLVEQRPWGAVELIEIANGRLYGASDRRRPAGVAVGY
jgi:gamma-glutamyltranspeptidase